MQIGVCQTPEIYFLKKSQDFAVIVFFFGAFYKPRWGGKRITDFSSFYLPWWNQFIFQKNIHSQGYCVVSF